MIELYGHYTRTYLLPGRRRMSPLSSRVSRGPAVWAGGKAALFREDIHVDRFVGNLPENRRFVVRERHLRFIRLVRRLQHAQFRSEFLDDVFGGLHEFRRAVLR